MKRFVLLLLVLLTLPALAEPKRVEIDYTLSHNGLAVGSVHETYQRQGDAYRIESETRAHGLAAILFTGSLRAVSEGEISTHGLRPLRYEQTRSDAPKKNISASFDWQARQLTHTFKGRSETVTLPDRAQDMLSVLYQFMFVKPGEKSLGFDVSTGRRLGREEYSLVGEETLATPAGELKTLHYRNRPPAGEKSIEVWLATDKHSLPVRVRVVEDGATALQTVTRIKTE